jgi:hypothetical protein
MRLAIGLVYTILSRAVAPFLGTKFSTPSLRLPRPMAARLVVTLALVEVLTLSVRFSFLYLNDYMT